MEEPGRFLKDPNQTSKDKNYNVCDENTLDEINNILYMLEERLVNLKT